MTDGIKSAHRAAIVAALAINKKVERAVLFGSRATQTHSASSDVDIALFGERLTSADLTELSAAMDKIPMAQSVDLVCSRSIDNPVLLKHIREQGVEWYGRYTAFKTGQKIGHEYGGLISPSMSKVEPSDGASNDQTFHDINRLDGVDVQDPLVHSGAVGPARRPVDEKWRHMPFTEAVVINPEVHLERGMTYPFVDMGAVIAGSRCVHTVNKRIYSGSGSRFQGGDTLMARITPCLENGKIARYCTDRVLENAHGSTEFIVIRGRSGVTDSEYAYYLTQWEGVRSYAIDQMTGTSGCQQVPVNSLDHLSVPVPPLPEQRAIVHILGVLDNKIELNRRMNETLEAMVRALFQDWFVDFGPVRAKIEGRDPYLSPDIWELFPDALDDENKPAGWIMCRVGDFLELAYGKSLSAKKRIPGKVPVYGSAGLVGTHTTALIEGPAVIVGRKGTVGSLYWVDGPVFPIDTVFHVVPCIGSMLFSYHLLATQPLQEMNTDAAVPGLNRGNVYRLQFPQPTLELILAFDNIIDAIWQSRAKNLKEIETLSQTRDLLLPKLISGQIRLRDVEKVVEVVV